MCFAATPAAVADSGPDASEFDLSSSSECEFGGKNIPSTPWSLQRILMEQLHDKATGDDVTVAVIDTGVDDDNKQLAGQMASKGKDFVGGKDGTEDIEGHGTRVAGIIAAKEVPGTGFMGLAPKAKILPIRYTGAQDKQGKPKQGNSDTMVAAIKYAVDQGADIINISSDTEERKDPPRLRAAIKNAVDSGALVIAASGNDGWDATSKKTYPASYDGVVAVAASDRNDERASFSQAGDFVDIAAPGVGMVSTVPEGGQCTADGTSFAAPYVAGVAALMMDRYPDWNAQQIIARMQETAERPTAEPNRYVGWGVVDPLAALSDSTEPGETPKPEAPQQAGASQVTPMKVTMGETPAERDRRISIYVLGAGLLLVFVAGGSGIAVRDWRRKKAGGFGSD
ncbi:type VII secretion-associated serine protease mycosin [Streptomyces luteolus]|uniref:Type VII secretion-associated serine protease mycosin n=1 Tax=Streptomyces luteolus TaxID=3043615 RepID=A0ABT6SYS7_9ACTN|nr:type VII secretion-associated serine protease mycosin [Streptomyces sp. B-S-A12]MDI3420765.1 type VII secretion-associated serine protease mycosin [Streptomyces sp. B-S-A12]